MYGLKVNNIHLDQVLKPIVNQLDQCWWYLGAISPSVPGIRPPALGVPKNSDAQKLTVERYDPADWERFLAETEAARCEAAQWICDAGGYRVGKPGFFARYASGMKCSWQIYCASDSPELPISSLGEFQRRYDGEWSDPPPDDLPDDICLITRDVDGAYLDVFFRNEWTFKAIWGYLETTRMKFALYHLPSY